MERRTSVLIAHHLSTIRHADVIFVLQDSALVEQGTHEQLLANRGAYASLYHLQMDEPALAHGMR
jgi:ATP-binding cassette subfamily B protein